MTIEEALYYLDTIPTIGDQVDALEMAIKSLEAWEKVKNEIKVLRQATEERQSQIDNIEIAETHGLSKEANVQIHNPQRERYMKLDGRLHGYDIVVGLIDKHLAEAQNETVL